MFAQNKWLLGLPFLTAFSEGLEITPGTLGIMNIMKFRDHRLPNVRTCKYSSACFHFVVILKKIRLMICWQYLYKFLSQNAIEDLQGYLIIANMILLLIANNIFFPP